jgi:phosphoribosylformimino-5-aminoimidazole carboxamide ribotide isomerase
MAAMRIVGVVDLLKGHAVHARAGERETYEPVRSVAGLHIEPGDAVALARGYLERLRIRELYAADLDAILGRSMQARAISALASLGAPLWIDAGITSVDGARGVLDLGASGIVVGLETLTSFDALAGICAAADGRRVAFSLDVRNGQPLASPELRETVAAMSVDAIAARAAASGAGALIVLDLARVGTRAGTDPALLARVRRAAPAVTLFAGGGVRSRDDLERLAEAGCDGALVATALHDGTLGAEDVEAVSIDARDARGRPADGRTPSKRQPSDKR